MRRRNTVTQEWETTVKKTVILLKKLTGTGQL